MDTISEIARGLNVKAPATIIVGEVVTVLHGSKQGLISDASKGMFAGVEAAKVARAARTAAGKVDMLNQGLETPDRNMTSSRVSTAS